MARVQIFTHGLVKTRISTALDTLVQAEELGYYFCNGLLLNRGEADLSGNPDGTFVSHEALATGRMTLIEGADGGFTELVGTADMVLEVVSESSVTKGCETLRTAYWQAGIPEYWLVDARGHDAEFHILKHGARG